MPHPLPRHLPVHVAILNEHSLNDGPERPLQTLNRAGRKSLGSCAASCAKQQMWKGRPHGMQPVAFAQHSRTGKIPFQMITLMCTTKPFNAIALIQWVPCRSQPVRRMATNIKVKRCMPWQRQPQQSLVTLLQHVSQEGSNAMHLTGSHLPCSQVKCS